MNEKIESEDKVISTMATQMKPKFEKYLDSYNIVSTIAAVLDPCFKFEFAKFCYKKVYNPIITQRKLEVVNQEMSKLFEAYEVQFYKDVPIAPSIAAASLISFRDDICVSYYTFLYSCN